MSKKMSFKDAVEKFAESIKLKMSQLVIGEPEEQLRNPFENLLIDLSPTWNMEVVCAGEASLPDRLGRPDFAIHVNKNLIGYVELKAPGTGVDVKRFKGHNSRQWQRFSAIPNILYTDGNEWALYRTGNREGEIVRLSGNVATDGMKAIFSKNLPSLEFLLRNFLDWHPEIPRDRKGIVDLEAFVKLLAPLCRLLRDDVIEALEQHSPAFIQLSDQWRQLLFPDASDRQFADAYAQTVTFALMLGRSEGAEPLTYHSAEEALSARHALLSDALNVLTDPDVRTDMQASLDLLVRVIDAVPVDSFKKPKDPWLHFYEHFLSVYDPELRKDAGAYYTPLEVVRSQIRLIEDFLVNRLHKPQGYTDQEVVTLDPATGTGTYLLEVINHALDRVKKEQGPGAVPGQATTLAKNLYGFELMVGPFAVTELRVTRAFEDKGAILPDGGPNIYLTDTLDSPDAEPPQAVMGFKQKNFAEQHKKATEIKATVPVIVCLGNPPYDRHGAIDPNDRARSGGWVHWGNGIEKPEGILKDFRDPASASGHGVHIRNLYNLYVYFWRWALWKVFEQADDHSSGIVSFITSSSYLEGPGFCGMREHMRRICDEIWIINLGGEGRGTRTSENVFEIRTPVAIAIALRDGKTDRNQPAHTYYTEIKGTREEKKQALQKVKSFASLQWESCPDGWQAPFRPEGKGDFFTWPLLTDLMPWQHPGVKMHRTWPICHDPETLELRWETLLKSKEQASLFRETSDRLITGTYPPLNSNDVTKKPICETDPTSAPPPIIRYAYRSFDRQWILADSRLGDRMRPVLWQLQGERQLFISSSLSLFVGNGPTLTVASAIMDFDHYCNRGAKDILPLYRSFDTSKPNINSELVGLLEKSFGYQISPEQFVAYVYGILANPHFSDRFRDELGKREIRVPLTKKPDLFLKVSEIGRRLIWLHTYGERMVPDGEQSGHIPPGEAKCIKPIPGDNDGYPESFEYIETSHMLHVGAGAFAPILPEVFEFEVSGLKVVQSWLKYRMRKGAGKKSSPLDAVRPTQWKSQYTTELLELLWVLEATLSVYPQQAQLLESILSHPCFIEDELPAVPDALRKPPKNDTTNRDLFTN